VARLRLIAVAALASLVSAPAFAAQTPFIAGNVETALELAKERNQLVFVYIFREYEAQETAPGASQPTYHKERNSLCVRVEREVLTNPDVLAVLQQMVCVAVSVEDDTSLLRRFDLPESYPTFAWLDTDGTVLAVLGACFDPRAYGFITSEAMQIRELRAKPEPSAEDRAALGILYYDVGRSKSAAEVLGPLAQAQDAPRNVLLVYAFAIRTAQDDVGSIQALSRALAVCTPRNATREEAARIHSGPAREYSPVVLERDGEFVGILYNLGTSPALIKAIDEIEQAATADPKTTEDVLAAAHVLYERENWPRAAALYDQAYSSGSLRGKDAEEAGARVGIAELLAGDDRTALKALDRYVEEKLDGPHRPEVLFYSGALWLGRSIDRSKFKIDRESGKIEGVTDQPGYNRAGALLSDLYEHYENNPFATLAMELLVDYYKATVKKTDTDGSGGPPIGRHTR